MTMENNDSQKNYFKNDTRTIQFYFTSPHEIEIANSNTSTIQQQACAIFFKLEVKSKLFIDMIIGASTYVTYVNKLFVFSYSHFTCGFVTVLHHKDPIECNDDQFWVYYGK